MEIVSSDWRPVMSAATTMALGLSWGLVSLAGGYVITILGYRSFFLMGAGLTALGATLFWSYFRRPRGEFARLTPRDRIE
jgi:predicted MFS family arabinose efflux permease